jgi:hypothetical protein
MPVWYFKCRNDCGVYREKSTGKRKQGEARDYKHDFLEKLRQNQLPTDEAKWTLAQALDRLDAIPSGDSAESIGGGRTDILPPPQRSDRIRTAPQ